MRTLYLLLAVLAAAILSLAITSCGSDAEGATHPPPQAIGFTGYEVVSRVVELPRADRSDPFTVDCPSGKVVLGGGWTHTNTDGCVVTSGNGPTADHTGWQVGGTCSGAINGPPLPVTVYAICADVD